MSPRPLEVALAPERDALLHHRLYGTLADERLVAPFMEKHVFAVWDFMNLVKSLQRALTCVDVPWRPAGDPVERRFINEIVLDEESDLDANGQPRSHFEMYVDAMRAAGADTGPIERFIQVLGETHETGTALDAAGVTPGVRSFVQTTLDLSRAEVVEVAAAFAYGRELLVPPMFRELVTQLRNRAPERFGPLAFYLERHIETDGTSHGPIANKLVDRLIGGDRKRAERALGAARRALEARHALWDEIADATAGL